MFIISTVFFGSSSNSGSSVSTLSLYHVNFLTMNHASRGSFSIQNTPGRRKSSFYLHLPIESLLV